MPENVPAHKAPEWARSALRQQLSKLERETSRLQSELEAAVANLKELAEDLSSKSEKDKEEKRGERGPFMAAKSVGRLSGEILARLDLVQLPSGRSFGELRQIETEASRLRNDLVKSRQQWQRLIRPYYILDMMSVGGALDKVGRLSGELRELLSDKGAVLKEFEDVKQKSDEILELLEEKRSLEATAEKLRGSVSQIDAQAISATGKAEKIKADPQMSEVTSLQDKLNELRDSVFSTGFVRLGRPLRKLESMSARGEYPLPPEVRDALSSYLKRPFGTLVEEEDGYPKLKSVLSSLEKAIATRKLSLKERERRKVSERVAKVVEGNSLVKLQAEAKANSELLAGKSADPQISELNTNYRALQKELRELSRQRRDVELELTRTSERTKQVQTRIESLCYDEAKRVEKLTGKKLLVVPG